MSENNISETIKRSLIDGDGSSDERDVRAATAPYQAEFPYERDEEAQVTRREFCNFLGLTSAALFLGSGGFAAKAVIDSRNEPTFAPARINGAETLPLNTALNFHYPGEKDTGILIRTETGEFRAYSQQCTHLACPVYYERQQKRLECPCHEGAFDAATGNVLYGPPPRPLDSIDLEMRNGELWAVGKRAIG